ncbi:MAG: nitroreductase family protein [Lachnospiraceae bacterium]|nr:nitroreductase family protein [Lachnospiraceae bacterium]
MKKNNNYRETFETQDIRRACVKTVRTGNGLPAVCIRAAFIVSLFATFFIGCPTLPVKAEESGGAGESEAIEMETETEAKTEENETDDQSVAEQVAELLNSFQEESEKEQSKDALSSYLVKELLDSQEFMDQIEDSIGSYLTNEFKEADQSIAEWMEEYISPLLTKIKGEGVQSAAELVSDIPTTQYFIGDPVTDEDIEMILTAGINSPSAMNSQPWHFSAVTDTTVLQRISDDTSTDIADVPLAIIVSCAEGSELDAGIACQTMSIEAQLLGYGSKILSSPVDILNEEEYRELLEIPEDYSVVAVLLVGYEDTSLDEDVDGNTSATTRDSSNEVVTMVE